MSWWNPRNWFRPSPAPQPTGDSTGSLIVTEREAQSIPSDSKTPIKVVHSGGASSADSLATGGSSGGGSSRGPIDVSTGDAVAPSRGVLITEKDISQEQFEQKLRQDKIEMDKLNRQRQAEIARQEQIESAKGFGAFIDREGYQKGFVTSTGEFFPTQDSTFVPSGYVRGEISDFDSDTGSISLAFTEEARTPSLGERAPVDVATGQEQTPVLEKKQLGVIDGIPQVGFTVRTPWTGEEREVIPKKTNEGLVFDIGEDYEDVIIPTDTITLPPIQRRLPLVKLEDKIAKGFRKELDFVTTPLKFTEGGKEFREKVMDFGEGAVRGVIPTSDKEIMQDAALYAATYGIGAGFKLAGVGGKALIKPLIGATKTAKVSKITAKTFSIGGKGLLGLYGGSIGIQIARAETDIQRGEIFGKGVKDITIAIKGSKLGTKTVGKATDRIKIREITRALKEPKVTELTADIVDARTQKMFKVGSFEIVGEKRPPLRITETTALRRALGLKPIKVTTKPARTFKVLTQEPVISIQSGNAVRYKPFTVAELTKGSKVARLQLVTGSGKPLTSSEVSKLTKIDKFTLKRLLEQTATQGRPIRIKDLSKFMKETTQFSKADIITKDLFKLNVGRQSIKLPTRGKTSRIFQSTSRADFVRDLPSFKQFKIATTFKDVTKPFPRARGRTSTLEGELFQLKKPITVGKVDSIGFTTPTPTKPTSLDTTFQKQITKTIQSILPKPVIKMPKSPPVRTITETVNTKRLMGQEASVWAGTGLYEQSDFQTQKTRTKLRTDTRDKTIQRASVSLSNLTKQNNALITKSSSKSRNALKTAPAQKSVTKLIPRLATRQTFQPLFTPAQRANFFKFKIPKVPTTKTPPFSFPKFDKVPRFTPRKRKLRKGKEPLLFATGFTARALGITKEVTQKELEQMAVGESRALGIRAIPILRNNKRKNNLSLIN